jgi:CRP-like cAMP-binding protein
LSATTHATNSDSLLEQLRSIPLFTDLRDEDRDCIGRAEERRLVAGEILVRESTLATHFFVLLEGEVSVSKKYGDQRVVVARYRPGAFFGEVPLLLDVPYILTARAEQDSRLIVFPAEGFWALLRLCPLIAGEIFRAMAVRLRNLEGSNRQQEKLASLGRMSAGLAHELNNPAAAAQRIAVYLGEVIQTIQGVAHELHQTLEGDQWERLIRLADGALKNLATDGSNHSIEQSDSEDVLGVWLKENDVPNAWKIAPISSVRLETSTSSDRPSVCIVRKRHPLDGKRPSVLCSMTRNNALNGSPVWSMRCAPARDRSALKRLTSMFMSKSETRSHRWSRS